MYLLFRKKLEINIAHFGRSPIIFVNLQMLMVKDYIKNRSMKLQIFFVLLFFVGSTRCYSQEGVQYQPVDSAYLAQIESLMIDTEKQQKVREIIVKYEKGMLKSEMSYNTDGWNYALRGLMLGFANKNMRKNAPVFEDKKKDWQDYGIVAIPYLATYLPKLCGIESRSTYKRLVLSNAMSAAFTIGLCQGLKMTVDERRPNGKDNHSMPSRHAALAFMGATILHREYGHYSPWISVGGYTVATGTQFLRMQHNAHWSNDVFMGAGIGVVAANLSYFLTDKILGESGLASKPKVTMKDMERAVRFDEKPSGLLLTTAIEGGHISGYQVDATYSMGLEYSHYFNSNVAAELIGRTTTTRINEIDDNLVQYHFDGAAKYSCHVIPGLRASLRGIAGARIADSNFDVDSNCMEIGAGFGFDYLKREKYATSFSFDYYHAFSSFMNNRYMFSLGWKILL